MNMGIYRRNKMIKFILGFLFTIFLIAVIVFCLVVGGDR